MSTTAIRKFTGMGSPEGVLAAPTGSIYNQTDAGSGNELWVKGTGTGNTGWRVSGTGGSNDVATVSALESLRGVTDGDTRYLLGYYRVNDGGGGKMRRNASSSATRNGGTIFTSADGGRWERIAITNGVYNILHFGGGTGVAATDETAMTNAVATIKAEQSTTGGVLVFPAGQYYLQGGYDLDSRVNLMGTHWRGTQINHSGNNPCVTLDPANGLAGVATRVENITFWSTNPTATAARAVLVREMFKARIKGCYFGNYQGAGEGPLGAACVELRNERSGNFTEGTLIEGCFFVAYNSGLLLNRVSGTSSFSNTRVINDSQFQNTISGATAIYVGDGCVWYAGTIEAKIMHQTQTVGQNTTGIRLGLPGADSNPSSIIQTRINIVHEGYTAGVGVTGTGIKMKYYSPAYWESGLLNASGFYELYADGNQLSHDIEAGILPSNFIFDTPQAGFATFTTETPVTVTHNMTDYQPPSTLVWTGVFASERIAILSNEKRYIGRRIRIVRSSTASGAGALNVRDGSTTGTVVQSLTAAGQGVTVMWTGSAWVVTDYATGIT